MIREAVAIIPLGAVEERLLESVALALWSVFGLPVETLGPAPDPVHAFDPKRGQYSSPLVLKALQERAPQHAHRVLGITEKDLFIPMLSFVYGQAQVRGRLALLSTARLRQEFYGLPGRPEITQSRAVKEAIHEMGHTFGLVHCAEALCPMSLSNTITQVDRKRDALCDSCARVITVTVRGASS
jgi:archaemetzincin